MHACVSVYMYICVYVYMGVSAYLHVCPIYVGMYVCICYINPCVHECVPSHLGLVMRDY